MYENNYPSDNTYTSGNTYHYEQSTAPKPNKPKKEGTGTGRKIALGICCGLLFGIFAGLGFEAVTTATGFVKEKTQVETSAEPKAEESSEAKIEETITQEVTKDAENSIGTASLSDSIPTTTVTDVTSVVKEVMPAVVSVNNKYVETTSFWGQQYSSEGNSTGSGIIVGQNDTELLLVTNYHVVESAEELSVQFMDGTQAQAQIKGSDADKDLAVIAVQLSDIDSSTKEQIAIGNALGYGQSVTTGVVSALNRAIAVDNSSSQKANYQGDSEVNTFIQTDAAINPGNSGGALLNMKGEVIGINSNKIGGSAVEGMGYAIPISDAKPIIEDLMTKQTKLKVDENSKGYLGITGIDVVAEYSEIYGMPQGVYVSSVSEGTGAAKAGLIKGDIITALNGEEIKSMDDLKNELSYYAAGTTVELTIMQGSPTGYQAKTVEVTLGAATSTQ